jgi:thiol-disulfide isomerase/thioredoxin
VTAAEIGPAEGDEWDLGVEEEAHPLVVVGGAREDEAIDGAATDDLTKGVDLGLAPMRREQEDVHVGVRRALGHLVEERVEEEAVTPGRDAITDGEGAALGQGPSGPVGAIAEPVSRLDHLPTGLRGDPLGGVESIRNSGDGHPGRPAHVTDRDAGAHFQHRPRTPSQKTFYTTPKTFLQREGVCVNGTRRSAPDQIPRPATSEPRRPPNIISPGKERDIRNTLRHGAAALAIVLAACGTPTTTVSDPTTTSPAAPASEPEPGPFDFTAQTLGGETIDGESLKYHDVVLWFWAPWCPTCLVEGKDEVAPALAELPDGIQFFGIAGRSDDLASMEEFLEWTGTGGVTHIVDIDGSIWEGFGVLLQPAFYFVNQDGTATKAGSGLTTADLLAEFETLTSS